MLPPHPATDFRHVLPMLADVLLMLDEFVADRLFSVRGPGAQRRYTIDDIVHEMETIQIVPYTHVKRRRRCAFFLVATHVNIVVVRPPVSQPVNEPGIAMKREDDRFVLSEERVEILIT